jgi:UDP-2,3-diacylglucosamine pyrophosphatase LpxH
MPRNRRIFVSDIHLGLKRKYDWFQQSDYTNLELIFDWIAAHRESIKDVILLGDIFDTWVDRYDEKPQTFRDIAEQYPEIPGKLAACTQGVPQVIYFNGNHDMNVTPEDIEKYFEGRVAHGGLTYMDGRLYAAHGHMGDMFNMPDPDADPLRQIPLGYFITRLTSGTRGDPLGSKAFFSSYADDIQSWLGGEKTLSEAIVEALMEYSNLNHDTKVVMPGNDPDMSLEQIETKYSDLFARHWHAPGSNLIHAIALASPELTKTLEPYAKWLRKQIPFKLAVFGHTHNARMDHGSFLCANTGCVCHEKASFLEVKKYMPKDQTTNSYKVWQWSVDPQSKKLIPSKSVTV